MALEVQATKMTSGLNAKSTRIQGIITALTFPAASHEQNESLAKYLSVC
jgi:hypothetical protein